MTGLALLLVGILATFVVAYQMMPASRWMSREWLLRQNGVNTAHPVYADAYEAAEKRLEQIEPARQWEYAQARVRLLSTKRKPADNLLRWERHA